MGGNGSFASGINKPYNKYKEVGYIGGIKVLEGILGHHKLPEESRTSNAYIRLKDNKFYEMRFYDSNHKLKLEIAYHPKPKLTGHNMPVLHYHWYDKNGKRSSGDLMRKTMRNRYKKYFKGVDL